MELKDFPRPPGDTGIGVHWSAGYPAALGLPLIEGRWLPLVRALGVKWVAFRSAGGLDFARLLLANEIMPVVQLESRAAGPLGAAAREVIEAYIAAGVRYFELPAPLDVPEMARPEHSSTDVAGRLASQLVGDVEAILQMGGLPGLPAWDKAAVAGAVARAISEAGHSDWLTGGVWQAYRIQAGNLPLDYPDDPVTQQGRPLSEEDYRRRSAEIWEGAAWSGRTRDQINAERLERRDPQASLEKTPAGWRRHELLDAAWRAVLGRSIPILGTAGGCYVGEVTDSRFPAVSPLSHAARILEMARIMMGVSQLYPVAPGYLFCAAFSLLGNYALGHFEPRWETWAWISPRRPGGALPIVEQLRDEPKRQRWGETATLKPLRRPRAPLDIAFTPFAPSGADDDAGAPPLKASPSPGDWPPATIVGRLAGGAGQLVRLETKAGELVAMQNVAADGTFTFRGLRAGAYCLTVPGTSLCIPDLTLATGEERPISLAMPTWVWRMASSDQALPFSVLRCAVEGRPDAAMTLRSAHPSPWPAHTGAPRRDRAYGREFAPLTAGHYTLELPDLDLCIELDLDGRSLLTLEILPTRAQAEPAPEAPPLPTDKGVRRYVLLARPLGSKEELFALLRFLNVHQPACGFSVAEAQWAREVIILGAGDLRVSEGDERMLRDSGCRVMRIERRVAETLIQLSSVGDPFANDQATP